MALGGGFVKLINMTCPNCGSSVSVNKETMECTCNSCGSTFLLDDETQHISYDNAEDAGYQFEKGRQKAMAEQRVMHSSAKNQAKPRKRRTWLWVLGWLFIFPLPLTILLLRNKTMNKKLKYGLIAGGWIIYLLIALLAKPSGNSSSVGNNKRGLKDLSLASSTKTEIEMTVGDNPTTGYVLANSSGTDFSPDDISFVSEDSNIATFNFTEAKLNSYLYYEIVPVSEGETYVYASSADGSIQTEKIHVIVHGIIEAESVSISNSKSEMILGEIVQLSAEVKPIDAKDKTISWTSSDPSVVKVDASGNVTAVSGGSAVITATTQNGKTSDCEISVDDSSRMVEISITKSRDDDNNIGDDWSYVQEINGESIRSGSSIEIAVGDIIEIHLRYSEDDDNPDVGEVTVKHTVTEDDFKNGFSEEIEVYVKENGGKNSGQSAHYITTITFSI